MGYSIAKTLRETGKKASNSKNKEIKMKHLLFICAVLISVFTVACVDSKTKAEIKAVLLEQITALEKEDIDAVMNTMAETDPVKRAAARQTYEDLFEKFDVSYKLVSFKVISVDGDDAVIKSTIETRKIGGAAPFQDNRTTTQSRMKKTASGWKDGGLIKIEKIETL